MDNMNKTTDENVDELRQRLDHMKKMMAERRLIQEDGSSRNKGNGFIDGSLLGFVFGTALFVIIAVSVYAFYNLYNAVAKKFWTIHDEL
ncbi:unnamed protein product [Brassicogethes aeneus]|uniref:Uncharacterized protein n=1 Tax=Brassicogethes aeneus TaxID=1431903 RepID=A0A9P0BCH2_BRAAE|nr:unnamed protein product [Brassicogethes aeneus]